MLTLAAPLAADRLRGERARAAALAALVALAPASAVYRGAYLASHATACDPTLPLETDAPAARLAHPLEKAYAASMRVDPFAVEGRIAARLLLPSLNVWCRVDTFDTYGAFEPPRLNRLALALGRDWVFAFRRFGLTHLAVPLPHDVSDPELKARVTEGAALVRRDEDRGFELWAVPHRPWAFFAAGAMGVPAPEYALDALLRLARQWEDGVVVVEAPGPLPTAPGRILRVRRGTATVELEAESAAPALLVVQDAAWPGWTASIDGRPTDILVADQIVRAVRWPAGRHRLRMVYDPAGVLQGLAVSAIGAALLVLLVVLAARRRPGS